MLKNHKLISLCIGLGFLLVVEKFALPVPVFRLLLPALLVYAGLVTIYNRRYLKQIQKYNIWLLLRPLLLMLSLFGLFFFTLSEFFQGLFLLLGALIIVVFEMLLGNQAENILLNETLVIAFAAFYSLFGAYYYGPNYGPVYLAGAFFASLFLVRSFYEFIPLSNKTKMVCAVAIGLFVCQLYWALIFLPFHFSILALLLFNFFYFFLILNYYHLFHVFNLKKLQFHFLFMAVTGTIALLATPWRIVG